MAEGRSSLKSSGEGSGPEVLQGAKVRGISVKRHSKGNCAEKSRGANIPCYLRKRKGRAGRDVSKSRPTDSAQAEQKKCSTQKPSEHQNGATLRRQRSLGSLDASTESAQVRRHVLFARRAWSEGEEREGKGPLMGLASLVWKEQEEQAEHARKERISWEWGSKGAHYAYAFENRSESLEFEQTSASGGEMKGLGLWNSGWSEASKGSQVLGWRWVAPSLLRREADAQTNGTRAAREVEANAPSLLAMDVSDAHKDSTEEKSWAEVSVERPASASKGWLVAPKNSPRSFPREERVDALPQHQLLSTAAKAKLVEFARTGADLLFPSEGSQVKAHETKQKGLDITALAQPECNKGTWRFALGAVGLGKKGSAGECQDVEGNTETKASPKLVICVPQLKRTRSEGELLSPIMEEAEAFEDSEKDETGSHCGSGEVSGGKEMRPSGSMEEDGSSNCSLTELVTNYEMVLSASAKNLEEELKKCQGKTDQCEAGNNAEVQETEGIVSLHKNVIKALAQANGILLRRLKKEVWQKVQIEAENARLHRLLLTLYEAQGTD